MWIIYTVLAAFFNALWTALSKRHLRDLSPFQFTLLFRGITALLLLPPFLLNHKISLDPFFWLLVFAAGALEVIGVYSQSIGVKKDFYSTFSLANTAPIFTLFLAPIFLPEKITITLILGAISIVSGGFIFYKMSPNISIHGVVRAVNAACGGIIAKIAIKYTSGYSYPFITFTIGIFLMLMIMPFKEKLGNLNFLKPFTALEESAEVVEELKLKKKKRYPLRFKSIIRFSKILLPVAIYSATATLLYYMAVEIAPITRVNPLVRLNLFFGFLLSYYMLKERENVKRKIFASALILAGSVLISIS